MACKSCKKKSGIIKSIIDIKNEITKPTNSIPDNNNHKLFNYEKVILTIFGWVPLCVGYYHIVRFIINLF